MDPRGPNPYYRCRSAPTASRFEENYWGKVVDPDGKQRDMPTERQRVLEDLAEELAFLNGKSPGRMLDVGCGLGFLLSGLDPRWERHGIELSRFAAEHAAQYGKIHLGDLRSADYPSDYFDVVTIYHVVEHMFDPCAELREVRRVLKPGGSLLIATPDFDSACARRFKHNFRLLHDKTHISLFSQASLRRCLEEHGFVIDRVEFPFFETRYFTLPNLERLFDVERISPPFHGNIMTFYARRAAHTAPLAALDNAAKALSNLIADSSQELEEARQKLCATTEQAGVILVLGENAARHANALAARGLPALPTSQGSFEEHASRAPSTSLLLVGDAPRDCRELIARAQARGCELIVVGAREPDLAPAVTVAFGVPAVLDRRVACDLLLAALCALC